MRVATNAEIIGVDTVETLILSKISLLREYRKSWYYESKRTRHEHN